jgi:FkbM family methyltransferase
MKSAGPDNSKKFQNLMKKFLASMYVSLTKAASGSGLYKHTWVKKINKFILRQIKGREVKVNGYTLLLDKRDSLNLSIFKTFEPFETNFFKNHIKPGDVVLDIGANIGYYSILFSRLVGDSGKVFAFEPDKENFSILTRNIASNKATNLVAEAAAVAAEPGSLKLYHSSDKGDQRIYDPGDGRMFYTVPAMTMDNYFQSKPTGQVQWIKMDIQGAEGYALEGMQNLIRQNKHVSIVCEFWPYGLEKSGYGVDKFFHLIETMMMSFQELNEADGQLSKISKEQLLTKYSPASKKFTNLILRHRDEAPLSDRRS